MEEIKKILELFDLETQTLIKEKRFPLGQMMKDIDDVREYCRSIEFDYDIVEEQVDELRKCLRLLHESVERYLSFYKECSPRIDSVLASYPLIHDKERYPSDKTQQEIVDKIRVIVGTLGIETKYLEYYAFEVYYIDKIGDSTLTDRIKYALSRDFDPDNPRGSFYTQTGPLDDIVRAARGFCSMHSRSIFSHLIKHIPNDWQMEDIFTRNNWVKYPWKQKGASSTLDGHTDKKYHHKSLIKSELIGVKSRDKKQLNKDFERDL